MGDNDGSTGFHLACLSENLNVVQFLLQLGFDMYVGDHGGSTGFHDACLDGKLNVVQFLVQQGFDMTAGDDGGKTGFHDACLNRSLNVVQFLVQQGFNMNIGDDDGCTGFHFACLNGSLNVIQFLVQQGFEGIDDIYFDDTGLEMLISQRYHLSDDELFMPCILLLIEAGARCNAIDVFEELISAIQNRIIEITFMKEIIFKKWTGRIAQAITDFTMDPFTNKSLQYLSQFLD